MAMSRCPRILTSRSTRLLRIERHLSSSQNLPVQFDKQYHGRIISLNRPEAFNAINQEMLDLMIPKFKKWITTPECNVIIMKSDHPKAFCAGGDVKSAVNQIKTGNAKEISNFFRDEYSFVHMLATCPKPFVAYMNGITMGGGVGLSGHAAIRVATEKTVFAMPETAIGLFTDVGGSFLLSQLPFAFGIYLGLTGNLVGPLETLALGLSSHFVPSHMLPRLTDRLCELVEPSLASTYHAVEEFSCLPPGDLENCEIFKHRVFINRVFNLKSVSAILAELDKEKSGPNADFAKKTLEKLNQMSPISLYMTHKLISLFATGTSISSALQTEWKMFNELAFYPDFAVGVTHKLIEKNKSPVNWPSKKATIPEFENISKKIFQGKNVAPLNLNQADYTRSPNSVFNYPSISFVLDFVQNSKQKFSSFEQVADLIDENWPLPKEIEHADKVFLKYFKENHRNLGVLKGVSKTELREFVRRVLKYSCEINKSGFVEVSNK